MPKRSCIRIISSTDGIRWKIVHEVLQAKPWVDATGSPKNVDHPVSGVIDDGRVVHFYVHHNYRGGGTNVTPHLTRYSIKKSALLDFRTRLIKRVRKLVSRGRRFVGAA